MTRQISETAPAKPAYFVHPQAIVDDAEIGQRTRIWAFAHIMSGAKVGADCNIAEHAFIEGGASLGNNVTVKNGVAVWMGVFVEDDAFLGPSCIFTNDMNPRSYIKKGPDGLLETHVRRGATIGAGAVIVCGHEIGRWAFVGAGAVVVRDVPDFALVVGNPARQIGWMCVCAEKLPMLPTAGVGERTVCLHCGSMLERCAQGLFVLADLSQKERTPHSESRTTVRVPFLDLKAQYSTIREDVNAAIASVVDSAYFVGGPILDRFEHEFADFVGTKFAVGVGNGTDALTLAVMATGINPGDEVLVPANTFFATAEAVSNAGATPVFVDVDPVTFHMDAMLAERAITSRTRAILPVHLYGRAVDMRPFEKLAGEYNLVLIEDCAQAHGASIFGQDVGSSGRLTCYSFYPGKNLGAYGDGGAITTGDPELNARLRILREHGSPQKYDHAMVGCNSRLDAIQAAVLSVKLRHLHAWNAARCEHARKYATALAGTPILPPDIPDGNQHVFHLFVVRCTRRDDLQAFLAARGISTGIHYPVPLHLTRAYQELGIAGKGSHPVAEQLAGEILSLPMFAELSDDQIQHMIDALHDFIRTEQPEPVVDVAAVQYL
jgi:dTDP-4-amino-4,6-dideoxygalactose transaminase/acetyltransferase-like isoleucine patch superfamily enzyme